MTNSVYLETSVTRAGSPSHFPHPTAAFFLSFLKAG